MKTKPSYKSIYDILKKDILDGIYPTGSYSKGLQSVTN